MPTNDLGSKVTPQMYERVFVQHSEGALILEDLLARFHDRKIWTPGGPEGARETERRAAQAEVIRFVLGMLGQQVNDEGMSETESEL